MATEVLPLVPCEAVVSRINNLVAWHEFLATAQGAEAALRLDGTDNKRPVEFNLNPFLAKSGRVDWLHRAPGAALDVLVESVLCFVVFGLEVWSCFSMLIV